MLSAGAAAPAHAQAVNLGSGGSEPIEIVARDGIEWNREAQQYIARGDARASQAGTTVEANVLTAYYREGANSRTEIYRYQADGNVRIYTPTHRAVGERAIFDIDTGVLVLTGKGLKLTTPGEVVTARDALEYWDRRHIAVARGDALVVTQDGRRMKGDLLTAHFAQNAARGAAARRATAARRADARAGIARHGIAAPAAHRGVRRRPHLGRSRGRGRRPRRLQRRDRHRRARRQRQDHARAEPAQRRLRRSQHQHRDQPAAEPAGPGGDNRVRGLFVPESQKKDGAPSVRRRGRRTP